MTKFKLLCEDCKHARKSRSGIVVECKSIGNLTLCGLYGKCRRYSPKSVSPTGLSDEVQTNSEITWKQLGNNSEVTRK